MTPKAHAKLFMHGRSQAVRLPKEFRLPGKEVRIRKFGLGVLIEPIDTKWKEIFAQLDSIEDVPFMERGREQPPMPPDKDLEFD